jgi:prolyl 4-hydroxylase
MYANFFFYIICFCLLVFIIDRYDLYDYSPDVIPRFGLADPEDDYIFPEVIRNFISEEEATHILEKTRDKFEPSVLYGNIVMEQIRKSNTVWLSKQDPVIKKIISRVCDKCNLPFKNAEHLQVVKYDPSGYYRQHHDTVNKDESESRKFFGHGGHRVVTMLIYLNDDFEGGETAFLNLRKKIKPPKYGGILFYSLDKKRELCHPLSLHEGKTVLSGNKYVANIWLRQNKFIS